ncbi:MAG: hypothetical protein HXY30_02795 [Pseudorhodoplanes sp.]|nr:hypothetical protein [Pseudorhodoplanes sp.]
MSATDLKTIAIVDVREGGPLRHAEERTESARALRDDCLSFFPGAARPLLPLFDRVAKSWLSRSQSPYVGEVSAIAAMLGFSGVWFLNGSYQWGCTALAREEDGAPWLARTLDWPFPGLGRHVEVARKAGPAGEFYSVTWPGYVGALTAMAPGRFAASINQAPLYRRTRHRWLRPYDLVANAVATWAIDHIPPDQLLRKVFETCKGYAEARFMLETTPIARPVIFTIVGCKAGERCVIERREDAFVTREHDTVVANDWENPLEPWEGRVASELILKVSYLEAGARSRARRDLLANFSGSIAGGAFDWVAEPVLNRCTRIAAEMCPAKGVMRLVGYDIVSGHDQPQRVTEVCEIAA